MNTARIWSVPSSAELAHRLQDTQDEIPRNKGFHSTELNGFRMAVDLTTRPQSKMMASLSSSSGADDQYTWMSLPARLLQYDRQVILGAMESGNPKLCPQD